MHSVQKRESKSGQDMPFINCIREEMNNLILELINKHMHGFIGRNAFSVGIYATKAL